METAAPLKSERGEGRRRLLSREAIAAAISFSFLLFYFTLLPELVLTEKRGASKMMGFKFVQDGSISLPETCGPVHANR
jgi:hypothetical protein